MANEQPDKTEEKKKLPSAYLTDRVIIGAMIAINVVILQALISLQRLDDNLHNSATAIAVALPLLVTALLIRDIPILFGTKNKKDLQGLEAKVASFVRGTARTIISALGTIATLIGVGNVLYHVASDVGELFTVLSVVLYFLLAFYSLIFETPRAKRK